MGNSQKAYLIYVDVAVVGVGVSKRIEGCGYPTPCLVLVTAAALARQLMLRRLESGNPGVATATETG